MVSFVSRGRAGPFNIINSTLNKLYNELDTGYEDDVTQMYYEMLSEYAPNDIQDEIERTQQRLDELKARVSNIES